MRIHLGDVIGIKTRYGAIQFSNVRKKDTGKIQHKSQVSSVILHLHFSITGWAYIDLSRKQTLSLIKNLQRIFQKNDKQEVL